jgi:hypothetical protein
MSDLIAASSVDVIGGALVMMETKIERTSVATEAATIAPALREGDSVRRSIRRESLAISHASVGESAKWETLSRDNRRQIHAVPRLCDRGDGARSLYRTR